MNEEYGLVIISSPPQLAETLARALVENQAAACVQIVREVSTMYWWNNQVEYETESLLFVKTLKSCLDTINLLLKELHPYEIPELVFLPITGGSEKYLEWLKSTVHRPRN
ncbi:MAG: divalent-cation tolerance protein CutA [Spirochaetales bacterium]